MIYSVLLGLAVSCLLFLYVRFPYFTQDFIFALRTFNVRRLVARFGRGTPCYTILDRFADAARSHPQKRFLVFEGELFSYRDARARGSGSGGVRGSAVSAHARRVCAPAGIVNLSAAVRGASEEAPPLSLRRDVSIQSPALYIYTSGTTGLPKAAVINHHRLWLTSFLQRMTGVSSRDVLYICLPLYHSAGFLAGLTGAMERGITVVLRRKFSASRFWDDCREHEVTVIQYIGEVMRYLCNTPKSERDRDHRVRLALGNGFRAETWGQFLRRFGNVRICECYGATEGNIGFINYIGRVTAIHKMLIPFTFIKFDPETEEPVRDPAGLCETGPLVAKINKIAPFSGYAKNHAQTEKKKLRNVFKKGDLYFNTGDLILADRDGFLYFQDRIGDTFRSRGTDWDGGSQAHRWDGV
ncbi:hypothetical protein G5714_017452 [Onychostoma macrolepis]|uniref:Long-chain-fatty-acid--CoA ligase n=1 Tax=Onychostoma macrolepis TaxID=369639 RepID=A0A7J6C1E3_9TELE|nr:hypothetical protein G5714_017452 [Onychostoma macrolepis]